jgi:predicted TIM-barrel fold metal-dependent hydrolase
VRITHAQIHLMNSDMAAADVARAVLVPPSSDGTDASVGAARRWPTQFGVIGRLPVGERTAGRVEGWRDSPRMLGIRLTVVTLEEHAWLGDHEKARPSWTARARHHVPIMVYAPDALGHLAAVAGEHPQLRLIADHAGPPLGLRSSDLRPALHSVQRLRGLPNLALKISALPCYCADTYPFRSLRAALDMLLDDFGVHRLMWGSDLTRLPRPYARWVDAVSNCRPSRTRTRPTCSTVR